MTNAIDGPKRSSVEWRRPGRLRVLLSGELVFARLLIVPTLMVVLLVIGYPWIYSLWVSLNKIDFFTQTTKFVGLKNYVDIFRDPVVREALGRTVLFATVCVVADLILGMAMALVLNEVFKGRGVLRSIVLIPWAIAHVGNAVLWMWILNAEFGALNGVLFQLGIIDNYIGFFTSGKRAMGAVMFTYIWRGAPLACLLLLGGLQGIPTNLYRAAKVDGANAVHCFWNVTLPLLRPTLLIVLVLLTINAFMHFDLFFVLTRGGPGYSTMVFSILGYQATFQNLKFGRGTAILYCLSIICLILAVLYIRLLYRPERTRRAAVATGGEAGYPPARKSIRGTDVAKVPEPAERPAMALPRRLVKPRTAKRLSRAGLYVLAIIILLWTTLPFYWLFNSSLSTMDELVARPPRMVPIPPHLVNYRIVFSGILGRLPVSGAGGVTPEFLKVIPSLVNSIEVALAATLACLLLGSIAGWAYARHRQRSRFLGSTLMILLITRMIPGLSLSVPMFLLFHRLGLIDSKLGLTVAYISFTLPLVVWILKGYFEAIPDSLERAALVDGCSRLGSLFRVVFPVALPGLAAAGIFSFIVAFNEFGFALILTKTLAAKTITVVLSEMEWGFREVGNFMAYPALLAATVVAVAVPVALALVFQRRLVQGMLAGSLKG
jgi:multiple sugar transport system permease protein